MSCTALFYKPNIPPTADRFRPSVWSKLALIRDEGSLAEIAYYGKNNAGANTFDVELHYVLRASDSGFYCWVVNSNHMSTGAYISELRVVVRADPNIFTQAYNAERKGPFPTPQELIDAEVVQDATYRLKNGTVYTKYDWSSYVIEDSKSFHGIYGNGFGLWMISPGAPEYVNGGPMKQELMIHQTFTTPVLLAMLDGAHFGAAGQTLPPNWSKTYGPYFTLVTSGTDDNMILDAQQRSIQDYNSWPYQWMDEKSFDVERATVTGTIKVADGRSADGAYVILAEPGVDVYNQERGYIYYAKAEVNGAFKIRNVRIGNYTMYAFATKGDITDTLNVHNIVVPDTTTIDLGIIVWSPPAYKNLIWTIGQADRTAKEFKYGSSLRAYGVWNLVPRGGIEFYVGRSAEENDWYYAHIAGDWNIHFTMKALYNGTAVFTLAAAGADNNPNLDILINTNKVASISFGTDSSIRRSALCSGSYSMHEIKFNANLLKNGGNILTLRRTGSTTGYVGVMYDILKLEVA